MGIQSTKENSTIEVMTNDIAIVTIIHEDLKNEVVEMPIYEFKNSRMIGYYTDKEREYKYKWDKEEEWTYGEVESRYVRNSSTYDYIIKIPVNGTKVIIVYRPPDKW